MKKRMGKYRYVSRQQQIKVYAKATVMLGVIVVTIYAIVGLWQFLVKLL